MTSQQCHWNTNTIHQGHTTITAYTANLVIMPSTVKTTPPILDQPNHRTIQLKIGPDAIKWINSAANKIGRLAEGVQPHMPTGTEAIHFIHPTDMPAGLQSHIFAHMCQLPAPKGRT
jgi:hypothetical protein